MQCAKCCNMHECCTACMHACMHADTIHAAHNTRTMHPYNMLACMLPYTMHAYTQHTASISHDGPPLLAALCSSNTTGLCVHVCSCACMPMCRRTDMHACVHACAARARQVPCLPLFPPACMHTWSDMVLSGAVIEPDLADVPLPKARAPTKQTPHGLIELL